MKEGGIWEKLKLMSGKAKSLVWLEREEPRCAKDWEASLWTEGNWYA